jgi:DNA polymerase I-like protein with 3'-5' exonuclease and polymerase domains
LKLQPKKYRRLIFDAETDGLLDQVTVCHCVSVMDYDTGQRWMFRRNRKEDNTHKVVDLLDQAEEIWGHNIVAYDIPMLELLFGRSPNARIRDTLVLARLLFPDQKDKDFRLFEAGKLDGKNIGKHTLDSWGQRLGMYKGDYKAIKEEIGLSKGYAKDSEEMRLWVWGTWTQELEDYCANDVAVTALLVKMIESREQSPEAVYCQHRLADLMARQQDNGIPFDVPRAMILRGELTEEQVRLEKQLAIEFPGRFLPKKRMDQPPVGRNVNGGEFPDFWQGAKVEDRRWYGYPETKGKASLNYKDPLRPRYSEGAHFTPIVWQEFKPTSRPQITDRLQEMGWDPDPEDYTEKGNVKANDVILRRIIERFPVAELLADLLAIRKLMGQLADGNQAWLKVVDANGLIHGYVNPCGAVTTRATHAFPNMAQVPAVRKKKAKFSQLLQIADPRGIVRPNALWKKGPVLVMDKSGQRLDDWHLLPPTNEDGSEREFTVVILGLKGGWGYECRSLFTTFEGWVLVGSDLAGIELRCLAHEMAKYDGGAYGRVLLEGDIHSENQRLAGLDSRDTAKTFIYAFLYGAGDEKIGKIVAPLANPVEQAKIGKELKQRFLRNLPALNKVIRDIQRQAGRKYLVGLDKRRLFVRSKHAALNTDLQGMGATIANWWLLFIEDMLEEKGLTYGWDGDFVFNLWVHDEVQISCREGLEETVKQVCKDAATEAGKYLNFLLPVEASAAHGNNWAVTH